MTGSPLIYSMLTKGVHVNTLLMPTTCPVKIQAETNWTQPAMGQIFSLAFIYSQELYPGGLYDLIFKVPEASN